MGRAAGAAPALASFHYRAEVEAAGTRIALLDVIDGLGGDVDPDAIRILPVPQPPARSGGVMEQTADFKTVREAVASAIARAEPEPLEVPARFDGFDPDEADGIEP